MEKTMGSKISIQDIDQKASDFAKANFMKQLKEHHQNLEKENKHFKEANANLQRQLDEESQLWSELKNENKALKQENKELSDEMERIGKEARKLAFLVDKLKQAIETEERKA